MSDLLWTCRDGAVFSSYASGLRLEVARVPRGNGFRYQLLRQCAATQHNVALASGYRDELADALAAAERTARSFAHGKSAPAGAPTH